MFGLCFCYLCLLCVFHMCVWFAIVVYQFSTSYYVWNWSKSWVFILGPNIRTMIWFWQYLRWIIYWTWMSSTRMFSCLLQSALRCPKTVFLTGSSLKLHNLKFSSLIFCSIHTYPCNVVPVSLSTLSSCSLTLQPSELTVQYSSL